MALDALDGQTRRTLLVGRSAFRRMSTLATVVLVGCSFRGASNDYKEPPPAKVTVAIPAQQTVSVFFEKTGQVESVNRADVRARVRGYLNEILFQPGQEVNEGDILYRIEPDEYEAAVKSAEASLAAAEAEILVAKARVTTVEATKKNAERDLVRQDALLARAATSQADYDAALAARDAAEASFQAVSAAVETAKATRERASAELTQARLDLSYTEVKSPISGRVTKTSIKRGNLVKDGDVLATVVDQSQVYVNLSLSDREVLEFEESPLAKRLREQADGKRIWLGHPVFVRRITDDVYPFIARGDYVDAEGIDTKTGTLSLRAKMDNPPDDFLVAGLFVYVRVPIDDRDNALVVPEAAIQQDHIGEFVMVVNAENIPERAAVETGLKFSGWVTIEKGLEPTQRVVINGIQRARPGVPVAPIETTLEPPPVPTMQRAEEAVREAMTPASDASDADDESAAANGDSSVPTSASSEAE